MGEVWRVTTTSGVWAVKVLFDWDPPPPVPSDFPVQLAAADAGIPLPRPMAAKHGDVVVRVGESLVRAYEWVDLREPMPTPVDSLVASDVGRMLGTLHSLELPVTDEIGSWYLEAPDKATWESLVERAENVGVEWAGALSREVPVLLEIGEFVAQASIGPTVVCHRDFSPYNVLPLRPDGTLIVLDWENAGPLPPDTEVASALIEWTTNGSTVSESAARALIDAYQTTAASPLELRRSSFNVTCATYTNFLRVSVDQALDDPRHRDYATRTVTSFLQGMFTQMRTNIDALVEMLNLSRG
jgi:aminoglycoside phosphotransferase (APT) family kinase protein